LTNYDKAGFELIAHDFREFALSLGVKQITAIPMSALKGENVVLSGHAAMPWYDGPTLVETLELATVRSSQTVGFRMPVQRVSRPGESFRGYQGTIAGGSVKPGDSVVILPSGTVANVKQIVTFDLVRNAAVAGDAVTLVLDRQVDISRGDVISSIDSQPHAGIAFDAQLVALQPGGIEPNKRYWLKSGSRRQRVTVEPVSQLDLKNGKWQEHSTALAMNAIGKVHLAFDETAIFDPYELNRATGSFILIDPDTNNTVAGGMIVSKRSDVSALGSNERVILSLPADLAEKLLSSELFANRRDDIDVRRTNATTANRIINDLS
jgi:sulfate adenylyltransferase subunit 1